MIKLQIRKYTYRGKNGYLVCGREDDKKTSIFFEHYNQAQYYVSSMKRGYDFEKTLNRIWG